MYDAFKKIEIAEDIRRRVFSYSNVDNEERASEIARRWFKG